MIMALDTVWLAIHGPPKELIMDGESGIARSEKAQQYLKRKGFISIFGQRTTTHDTRNDEERSHTIASTKSLPNYRRKE